MTGDAAVRDNRRVLMETAQVVANYRPSKTRPTTTHTLAMVPPASDRFNLGFIRIINRSDRAGTVQVLAIDDAGRRFGPVPYSIDTRETKYFNSRDLENGSDRRLPRGVGDGTGNWRLELSADVEIEPLAYIRTSDGFLTSVNAVAAETRQGSTWRYHVPYFQPASPDGHRGRLRLINPGAGAARVTVSGVDDFGNPGEGSVGLTLAAGAARNLTTEQLEQGGSGLSGRLGDGVGRWRLAVASDAQLQVMSLLKSVSNHLTNVSSERAASTDAPPPERFGAIVAGWKPPSTCGSGYDWGVALNHADRDSAKSAAQSACSRLGLTGCGLSIGAVEYYSVVFTQCGALAYGSTPACNLIGGVGETSLAAELNAISRCHAHFDQCAIAVNDAGTRASHCNDMAGAGPDLVVESPRVDPTILAPTEGASFHATVRNRGTAPSAATRYRILQSTDATISPSDTEINVSPVDGLPPSGSKSFGCACLGWPATAPTTSAPVSTPSPES